MSVKGTKECRELAKSVKHGCHQDLSKIHLWLSNLNMLAREIYVDTHNVDAGLFVVKIIAGNWKE